MVKSHELIILPRMRATYVLIVEVDHVRAADGEPALFPVLVQPTLLGKPPTVHLLRHNIRTCDTTPRHIASPYAAATRTAAPPPCATVLT